MLKIALTAAAIALAATPAFAQTLASKPDKPDCKAVEITRPKVTASPIVLRLGQFDKKLKAPLHEMIKSCNEGQSNDFLETRQVDAYEQGADIRVKSTTGEVGTVKILLPIDMTESKIESVVCLRPAKEGDPKHAKYAVRWSGTLPSKLEMSDLPNYDKAAADAGCGKLTAAAK